MFAVSIGALPPISVHHQARRQGCQIRAIIASLRFKKTRSVFLSLASRFLRGLLPRLPRYLFRDHRRGCLFMWRDHFLARHTRWQGLNFQ
ncbi:MAG TPA: hypothetical protein DDW21_06330 [Verrucomicrobiales bacterium]|nr:hypothetical protein [Verrucomicrobiales bacterium]